MVKHQTQSSLYVPMLLLLTIFLTIAAIHTTRRILSFLNYASSFRDRDFQVLQQLCEVTHDIESIRRYRNTSEVDPAKHVVSELLKIVTQNPANVCMKDQTDSHLIVVIVHSSRGNFMERKLIRRTWGSVQKYRGWRIHTVFLLGQSDYCLSSPQRHNKTRESHVINEELNLMSEYKKYGDFIVGAFADTFKNQTYKHLMGYKFVLESCPDADLIVKTDDEMFVDIPKIVDMREQEMAASLNDRRNKMSEIFCHPYQGGPVRCQDCAMRKWYTTREEWPEDTYPEYCLGNDYVISSDWLQKIYAVKDMGGFFWIDDVFVMGKLREIVESKSNYGRAARRRNITENVMDMRGTMFVKEICGKEGDNMFVFLESANAHFEEQMECLWKVVLKRKNILTIKDD